MKKIITLFLAGATAFGAAAQCVPNGAPSGNPAFGGTMCQIYQTAPGNAMAVSAGTNISTCTGCAAGGINVVFDPYFEVCVTVTSPNQTITVVTTGLCARTFTFMSLPVELSSFKGSLRDGATQLNWQTLSELNNDRFTVERSFDGSKFEPIGDVRGAGYSVEVQNYVFLDPTVAADATSDVAYYRLSQSDKDGRETQVGQVVAVLLKGSKKLDILSVRADGGETVLDFSSPIEQSVSVQVFDLSGRQILAREVNSVEGVNQESLDLGALTGGIFFATVRSGQQISTVKFAK